MSNLPKDWELCQLGDVVRLKNGYAFKSGDYAKEGMPLVRISNIQDGKVSLEKSVYIPQEKANLDFTVRYGDLLIAMSGATTGKTGVYFGSTPCLQNQRIGSFQIISKDVLDEKYRNYYVESLRKEIEDAAYGGAQPNISAKGIEAFLFPLAPPEQQKRIVAEIEKQFSRLDEAVANLKRVKANLKRYKAALLKAAVEGKLTEEWRKQNPDVEPADKLLERILVERREKWQGRGKYKEPAVPDTTDLSELPEGWVWTSTDQLLAHITDGDHQAPPQTEKGIPFLVIGNVRRGEIDFSGTRFVGETYYESLDQKRQPKQGDLLYTLVGSYGIPVPVKTEKLFCIQRHMAILRPHDRSPIVYLAMAMDSDIVFKQATAVATGTAQMTVPLAGLRKISIPLPPSSEQHQIVAAVECRLSIVARTEAQIDTNMRRADRLRQSILKKAFSGRLICASLNFLNEQAREETGDILTDHD